MCKTQIVKACEILKEQGHKITEQRRLVIETALQPQYALSQSKEIYAVVSKTDPSIGVATVYRTMRLLRDEKIIEAIHNDVPTMYNNFLTNKIICPRCGKLTELDNVHMHNKLLEMLLSFAIAPLDYTLNITAYCKNCKGDD